MSLSIYFEGVDELPDMPIERDVETLFMTVRLDGCDYDKTMLREIEEGQFVDNFNFIDRFGCTLARDCLSTGTKAALSLYHMPDVMIWGVEMSHDALAEIVKHCMQGTLLLPASNYYVRCKIEDCKIDVVCKGRHYTSMHEFAEYMMEDAPYEWEEGAYD